MSPKSIKSGMSNRHYLKKQVNFNHFCVLPESAFRVLEQDIRVPEFQLYCLV